VARRWTSYRLFLFFIFRAYFERFYTPVLQATISKG
jgi:hypothetical protein